MGTAVLKVALGASPAVNTTFAAHAWCASAESGAPPGGVVLIYFNLDNGPVQLTGVTITAAAQPASGNAAGAAPALRARGEGVVGGGSNGNVGAPLFPRTEYIVTPIRTDNTADAVLLNGVLLGVNATGHLPALPIPGAEVTDGGTPLLLAGYSVGFIVLPAARHPACM